MCPRGQPYGEVIDGQGFDKWQDAGYIWPEWLESLLNREQYSEKIHGNTLDKIIHRTRKLYIIAWYEHQQIQAKA